MRWLSCDKGAIPVNQCEKAATNRSVKSLLAFFVFLVACLASATDQSPSPKHFPDFAFSEDPRLDRQIAKSRIDCLTAMGEPSILGMSAESGLSAFRFTWLPAWDRPIAVRIQLQPDGTSRLTAKSTQGKYWKPGKLKIAKEAMLSNEETAQFLRLFEATEFWKLPSRAPASGRDGADWLFEATQGGRYHMTQRWSPKPGSYRDLGLFLIRVAGLSTPMELY
jgi:hypothetical protein